MNNNFVYKIYHHEKLNLEDIREFWMEQVKTLGLEQYVNVIKSKRIWGFAEYNSYNKEISISKDYRYDFKSLKKRVFKPSIIDIFLRNDTDLFNLYIIYAGFHELWHAKQEKEINENKDSDYSILLKSSLINQRFSGSLYNHFHNRYFFEHDAIINSIMISLDFIKSFNFNKRSLVAINKYFAGAILESYGIDHDHPFGDKYKSPIEFFNIFIDDNFIIEYDKRLTTSLRNCQLSLNEFENLINGYKISTNLIEKLKSIRDGSVDAIDIIDEIKNELDTKLSI